MDGKVEMLRHAVATLAYRTAKALRGAPPEFAQFQPGPQSRAPVQILAHMGDLFDWALKMCDGRREWHNATPLPWDQESARFFRSLDAFDARLRSGAPLGYPPEKIFQGPVADALTHAGQLAMLRHLAGCKITGESYFAANIETGRVGAASDAQPVIEFSEGGRGSPLGCCRPPVGASSSGS